MKNVTALAVLSFILSSVWMSAAWIDCLQSQEWMSYTKDNPREVTIQDRAGHEIAAYVWEANPFVAGHSVDKLDEANTLGEYVISALYEIDHPRTVAALAAGAIIHSAVVLRNDYYCRATGFPRWIGLKLRLNF